MLRKSLFGQASVDDLCYMINSAGWVFDDAEYRYTIVLTSIEKGVAQKDRHVRLRGPYRNIEQFRAGVQRTAVEFAMDAVLSWTDTAALPFLPNEESAEVFAQLRKSPRLDFDDGKSWRARPHRELDATNDKKLMILEAEQPQGSWPVFSGESFDLWVADRGTYYAWADPEVLIPHLLKKRQTGKRRRNSVWFDFALRPDSWFRDKATLPCYRPRIAFKDVVRNTDSRTVKVGLIPPYVFIANTGPYFLWIRGDDEDEAFLLGLLSSIPLDWYSRRFVELHMSFFILNGFPIPRPERGDSRWQRVVGLAARLGACDDRLAPWAETVDVECGPVEASEKDDMISELDAVVAHLYGLSEKQVIHIFETFHEGWDYTDRLKATLKHYRTWKGKA